MWVLYIEAVISLFWLRPFTAPVLLRLRQFTFPAILFFLSSSAHSNPPDKIVVAGDSAYPPFEQLADSEPLGFNIGLVKAMADVTNTELEFELNTWPDAVTALESGEADVVAMFASDERNGRFLFSSPFYYLNHSIFGRQDAPPAYTLDDLRGKRIAMEARSYAQQQLDWNELGITPLLTANTLSALRAVASGEADYAVLANPVAETLIRRMKLPLTRMGPPFWPAAYVWAVNANRPELMAWLQGVLGVAVGTGRYQQVYSRWEDELEGQADRSALWVSLLAIISALLLITAVVLIWLWSLRAQVKLQTRDLREALTRAREAESRALHLYNYDTDTGLAKAHHFIAQVNQRIAASDAPMEMLVIKMAGLNELVKVLGKRYADNAIRDFAGHIGRHSGSFCAYFGRGVFAVFSDHDTARNMFQSLLARWTEETRGIYSHIVAGSASYPEHGRDGEELLQRAETALAVSRSNRRRWMAYDPSMEPVASDLEIVAAFRSSRLEGLYPVIQPQMDLQHGCLSGAEVLARWDHPLLGSVSPTRFIPLIEKAGLVSTVTRRMITEAVRLSVKLRHGRLSAAVSVNVTISDLTETDLVGLIREALDAQGGRAEDIKLELTESSVASDFFAVRDVLQQLHQLGVGLAVDDFGTGYSSLSYLSIFPIDEVKIDQSFIAGIAQNEKNRSIVRSTVTLSSELGLQTVAEGADDPATLDILRELGCNRVQGFAVSQPLREEDFFVFANRHRPRVAMYDVKETKAADPRNPQG